MVEKVDVYVHYLTLGVIAVFIIVGIIFGIEFLVGLMTAISMGG